MPAPDLDVAKIRKYCDARVPAELRDRARIDVNVRGNSVMVFDCRPPWHQNLNDWSKVPVAQFRYKTDDRSWTLYWADRNGRWHTYDDLDPGPIDELLAEIDADPTGIFWG